MLLHSTIILLLVYLSPGRLAYHLRMQVATAAANVHIPEFVPRQGVQIETDPKATAAAKNDSPGTDDESIIESMISKLQVGHLLIPCAAVMCICHHC